MRASLQFVELFLIFADSWHKPEFKWALLINFASGFIKK